MNRQEARELLQKLDRPDGAVHLLKDLTDRMDLGLGVKPVGDKWFLGCWDGINKGLENFALRINQDISTPDKRQALVVLCTELFARSRIENEYGLGTEIIKRMRELHPFF